MLRPDMTVMPPPTSYMGCNEIIFTSLYWLLILCPHITCRPLASFFNHWLVTTFICFNFSLTQRPVISFTCLYSSFIPCSDVSLIHSHFLFILCLVFTVTSSDLSCTLCRVVSVISSKSFCELYPAVSFPR